MDNTKLVDHIHSKLLAHQSPWYQRQENESDPDTKESEKAPLGWFLSLCQLGCEFGKGCWQFFGEAPILNNLVAPTSLNYFCTSTDFYVMLAGIDELATTFALFPLEVPQWIMKRLVWSSRNDLKAASVLFIMATVGNAYHNLLHQVKMLKKTCDK